MTDAPTPGELDRRLIELARDQRSGFANLNQRLDAFPTEAIIRAMLETRDTQIDTLQRQVVAFSSDLAKERSDREAGDKEIEDRADAARRWAITTLITGLVGAATLLGFFINVMGGNPI